MAVGRLKPGPEKLLIEDYLKHTQGLGRGLGITGLAVREFAESRRDTAAGRVAQEAESLAGGLPPEAFTIVLDEHGKSLSSAGFADLLKTHRDAGTADLAFLIGGPDGHAPSTRESADLLLSLGAMTWPHRLVRVMLAEQIYRAVTILANHPYHRP